MSRLDSFKAYDIRGRLGADLDKGTAYRIGRGFARALGARCVVLGRDGRGSSSALTQAVAEGLAAEGAEVLDLGLWGTEELYFATTHFGADGGIEVTASYNPIDYNGMKMVQAGSAPLDAVSGLDAIRALAEADDFGPSRAAGRGGARRDVAAEARAAYVARVMQFPDLAALQPLTILVNSGNGAAGATFDAVVEALAEAGAALRFLRQHLRGVVRRGKMPALAALTGRMALTGRVMHVCRGAIDPAF